MFVYILKCADNSLYTGYTTELARRIQEHQSGKGSKYTRSRRPVELVWAIGDIERKSTACSIEYKIKQLKRKQKQKLIEGDISCLKIVENYPVINLEKEPDIV